MSQNFADKAKLVSRVWTEMLCDGVVKAFKMEIIDGNIQVTYTPFKPMKFVELTRTEIQFNKKFS